MNSQLVDSILDFEEEARFILQKAEKEASDIRRASSEKTAELLHKRRSLAEASFKRELEDAEHSYEEALERKTPVAEKEVKDSSDIINRSVDRVIELITASI